MAGDEATPSLRVVGFRTGHRLVHFNRTTGKAAGGERSRSVGDASVVGGERSGVTAGAESRRSHHRTAGKIDRSVGPAAAWPCHRRSPQFKMATQRMRLTKRNVQRPASAPVRSSKVSSSAPSVAQGSERRAHRKTGTVPARANPNQNHSVSHRGGDAVDVCWPHCLPGDAETAFSDTRTLAPVPLTIRRSRRRPYSAAARLSAASSTVSPSIAHRLANAGSTAGELSTGILAYPRRVQGWRKPQEHIQLARQLPQVARVWHSLCDPGFRVSARTAAVIKYTQASGVFEARRTELQSSWMGKVGSGTVLQLALARRRLAFATQLLPRGMTGQRHSSSVPRLTPAQNLAKRKARLDVLQDKEAQWSAEAVAAASELDALHREIEAMESIELEVARAHAALEAKLWTEKMKEQKSGFCGDAAQVGEDVEHQVDHRSRCLAGRGRCMLLLGNTVEALRDFEASLVAVPTSLEALWGKSQALDRLGRVTEAAAAMVRHDKIANKQHPTPPELPLDQDGQVAMSGVSVSSLSEGECSEVVLQFFIAGLPALHHTAELRASSPIVRTKRTAGNALTAKWMGRKTLMILLAWQSWASKRALFREQVKSVLRRVRELFNTHNHENLSPSDSSFVYDLPIRVVASEQNRFLQFSTASASAMRGCEDLLRQKASWKSGTGPEPDLTGHKALVQEKKIALSLEYEAKAQELQGRLVQMHGTGVQKTIESMRCILLTRADACHVNVQNAKRALLHIQKEAVQIAAIDASMVSEATREEAVASGPLFWKVMLGNLTRNAHKLDDADVAVHVDASNDSADCSFALLAVAAVAHSRGTQEGDPSHGLDGALDIEIVQWVCSRVGPSLMLSCSGCRRVDTQSSVSAVASTSNKSADRTTLVELEKQLALVDLDLVVSKSQSPTSNYWVVLDRQLVQHVLKFCEPPGLLAAAGTCRNLRASVVDDGWCFWQAMSDAHAMVEIAELRKLRASINSHSDVRSTGRKRVCSLIAQAKTLFLGLDDMDLVSVSLDQRPGAILEFVCEALWQITSTFMGDDGSATMYEPSQQASLSEDTSLNGAGWSGSSISTSASINECAMTVGTSTRSSNSCSSDWFSTREWNSESVGAWSGSESSTFDGGNPQSRDERYHRQAQSRADAPSVHHGTWWMCRASSSTINDQPAQGSRWDLGRKALRAVLSTGVLELDDPGGGPTFHSVLIAPTSLMREAVRRLLPYTAILLGRLEQQLDQLAGAHNLSINERVDASLACFVVVVDAHLRVKCGLPAEAEAVIAEATAARASEFSRRLSC